MVYCKVVPIIVHLSALIMDLPAVFLHLLKDMFLYIKVDICIKSSFEKLLFRIYLDFNLETIYKTQWEHRVITLKLHHFIPTRCTASLEIACDHWKLHRSLETLHGITGKYTHSLLIAWV